MLPLHEREPLGTKINELNQTFAKWIDNLRTPILIAEISGIEKLIESKVSKNRIG